MRLDPPFFAAPPLRTALLDWAGPATGTWWIAGSTRLTRSLERAGRTAAPWDPSAGPPATPLCPPGGVTRDDVLVLYHVLSRHQGTDLALRQLVADLPGNTRVAICEPASYGRMGQWLTRLLRGGRGRSAFGMDPGELSTLALCAGLTSLRQTWPQGLRSLVLITGAVHPVASRAPAA